MDGLHIADEEFDEESGKPIVGKRPMNKIVKDLCIWLPLTAYAIALMILGKGRAGYTLAIIVYVFITLRLLARHVSVSQLIYKPLGVAWDKTVGRIVVAIPHKWRVPSMFLITFLALFLTAMFSSIDPETSSVWFRLQSLSGILVILALMTATSNVSLNFKRFTSKS